MTCLDVNERQYSEDRYLQLIQCGPSYPLYPKDAWHGARLGTSRLSVNSKRIIMEPRQSQTITKQSLATATMSEFADKAEFIKSKLQEREEFVRESWVKAMEARLVRDELVKCHRLEGVNHLENCRWLSDKYISMLKENKVKGYKKIDF
ncbi:hypothetical protein C8R48DRAFT_696748 [Suillus tomentosus]|nr:hypothetical protein C8R48DRAFT_696748 [Suillus tomentosus]